MGTIGRKRGYGNKFMRWNLHLYHHRQQKLFAYKNGNDHATCNGRIGYHYFHEHQL